MRFTFYGMYSTYFYFNIIGVKYVIGYVTFLGNMIITILKSKYSVLPHITDKHMRFSPPPANTSGGYTLI